MTPFPCGAWELLLRHYAQRQLTLWAACRKRTCSCRVAPEEWGV